MNKSDPPPAFKIGILSTILAVSITDKATPRLDATDKLTSFLKKIDYTIAQYDGKIVSWLNEEIIIIFSSNNTSEKHVSRAYFCYQAISQIASRYNFTIKAFLNCAEIYTEGHICWGDAPRTSRDILYSSIILNDEDILFSESATHLLDDELIFKKASHLDVRHKLKLYVATQSKKKDPHYVFVGRKIEYELIEQSLMANHHTCVTGPAGIGKTSLVEHYLSTEEHTIIRCSFYENTYESLYQQIFDGVLDLLDIRSQRGTADKINAFKTCVSLTIEEIHFLEILYEEPYLQKSYLELGTHIFLKCLEKIAPKKNIFLFFDDVQWAIEEFEEFCSLTDTQNTPLRIISTSRTPPKGKENCYIINLKPLQKSEIRHVALELMPYDMITDNLINTIFKKTSGNPFYLKEIIRGFLIENKNFLYEDDAPLNLYDYTQLPLSLKNLISYQISLLSEEMRLILETCSCVGQRFSDQLIEEVLGNKTKESRTKLNILCEADFLKFSLRTNSYEFIHNLKEQNVYDSIPRAKRIAIHQKIANSLLITTENSVFPLLSRQLFHAEMWKEAYRCNLRDARIYIKNLEPRMAMEAIRRCMTCATEMHALKKIREIRLKLMLSKVYFIFGEVKSAQKFIIPVKDIFSNKDLLRFPKIWNEALNELTFFHWIAAEYDQALKIIDRAETEFSFMLNPATAGALNVRRIGIYSDIGRLEESTQRIESLLNQKQGNDFEDWTSVFPVQPVLYAIKSRNHAYMRQYDSFEFNALKALKLSSHETTTSSQIFTLCYVADGYIQFKNFPKATELLELAYSLMKNSQIYVLKSYIMSMMGYCEAAAGKSSGVGKISHAIYNAHIDGRLCRLPLFYLFLARSLSHVADRSGPKRHLVKGSKLAHKQGEEWVFNQISSYASNLKIQLDKPRINKKNVVNFSEYVA